MNVAAAVQVSATVEPATLSFGLIGPGSLPVSLALRVTTPYEPAQQAMAPILEDQDRVHHACEVETSMMMVLAPDTVRREKLPEAHGPQHWTPQPAGVARYVSFRDATVSGVIGDARRANAQKGEKLVAAMKGMAWESPRGPISIDPETRDIVQNIYVRKVDKVGGELYNVEFATIPNVKDPVKAAKK